MVHKFGSCNEFIILKDLFYLQRLAKPKFNL